MRLKLEKFISLAALLLTTGAGCASADKKERGEALVTDGSVMDVAAEPAAEAASSAVVTYTPAPVQPDFIPAFPDTSAAALAPAPAASVSVTSTVAAFESVNPAYKVQKGDTLFGLARVHYGDGKRWEKIAAANPGVTPATLKAGSTIVIP